MTCHLLRNLGYTSKQTHLDSAHTWHLGNIVQVLSDSRNLQHHHQTQVSCVNSTWEKETEKSSLIRFLELLLVNGNKLLLGSWSVVKNPELTSREIETKLRDNHWEDLSLVNVALHYIGFRTIQYFIMAESDLPRLLQRSPSPR